MRPVDHAGLQILMAFQIVILQSARKIDLLEVCFIISEFLISISAMFSGLSWEVVERGSLGVSQCYLEGGKNQIQEMLTCQKSTKFGTAM